MILRRLSQHLRSQNWLAVVLDFLIVVIGVFIGIQMSNWNEAREQRNDEREVLLRLDHEIESAIASFEDRVTSFAPTASVRVISEKLFGPVDNASLSPSECKSIALIHYMYRPSPSLPTLRELVASGRLAIIRSEALRMALSAYSQTDEQMNERIRVRAESAVNLPMAFPAYFSLSPFWDDEADELRYDVTCDSEAMRKDRNFLNLLAQNLDLNDGFRRDAVDALRQALVSLHEKTAQEIAE